jgi:poly(3-hydroxybutyrate) depolymerase
MIQLLKALPLALLCASASAAERLGAYPVDPAQVSVSGLSSGTFMANQLHIAHSTEIMGAAMVAGGLYGCAVLHATADGVEALASQAGGPCVSTPFLLEDVSFYTDLVKTLARKAEIDPPSNLAHSRIYLFTGGADSVVSSATVEKGRAVYAAARRSQRQHRLRGRQRTSRKSRAFLGDEKLRRQVLSQQSALHQRLRLRPSRR